DDPVDADPVYAADKRVEFPSGTLCDLGPVAMASLGVVPFTPWHTERETSEEDLAKEISSLLDSVPDGRACIMNFHCPPYGTGLDDAPDLDATLKPVIRGGRPSIVPVGSHAVRDAIKKYQPPVSLHGHIHESRGVQRLGRTLCVNPGSDYSSGVLRGAVVDIAEDGTGLDFLLTTGETPWAANCLPIRSPKGGSSFRKPRSRAWSCAPSAGWRCSCNRATASRGSFVLSKTSIWLWPRGTGKRPRGSSSRRPTSPMRCSTRCAAPVGCCTTTRATGGTSTCSSASSRCATSCRSPRGWTPTRSPCPARNCCSASSRWSS